METTEQAKRPDIDEAGADDGGADDTADMGDDGLHTIRACDVKLRKIRWLWENRFAIGKVNLIAGEPKTSKSMFSGGYMAAAVSRGGVWFDGAPCERGRVLIVQAEDAADDTVVPRLVAHGANLNNIDILDHVRIGSLKAGFQFEHVDLLRKHIKKLGGVRLVILDPVGSFCGKADSHKDTELRSLIAPLNPLAEEVGACFVLVAHFNKSGKGNALSRVMGSVAWTGVSRMVWTVTRDPEDRHKRVLAHAGGNVSKEMDGIAYRVETAPPFTANGVLFDDVGRIVYTGTVEGSADDQVSAQERHGPQPKERARAERWLRELLEASPRTAADVKKAARDAAISEATLRRAKEALGVQVENCPPYRWSLPDFTAI